ncbi:periodic tryptophan protein 2 homolog [Athalia rosae]|uniref:periodic tryptophan protein 2 homolog n=1 Tax=Athalia rosae TaxID=37344 RepID=UPI0020335CC7|nr:periodic tryptophan protein 2 homolog [Athalia rosae]
MKFAYKFSNLLGTVYNKGDLIFSPDGYSVISPVGNRITIFDLKNNKSMTLPVESRFNFTAIDIAPNGVTLIAINEEGEASLISLISRTVIHKYRFKRPVACVKFSPDGKHFAACKQNNVFVFKAPGLLTGEFNPFVMERIFHGAQDDTTFIDWSSDSKILAVGSRDNATRLYSLDKWANFRTYTFGSHTNSIVACFFEKNSYDISTISSNGQLCVWECSIEPDALKVWEPRVKKQKPKDSDSEDDIDLDKALEKPGKGKRAMKHSIEKDGEDEDEPEEKDTKVEPLRYKRLARHYLGNELQNQNRNAVLTSAAYHRSTKILVTGFSHGAFFIHEMPEVNMIHSLSISDQCISAISLNNTGDWIALGCSSLGQLLVWEWQSESYAMKQQGHGTNMNCLAYSPDGQYIVTGGDDGKVKLWNASTGFCTITFHEHTSAISGVLFSHNRKFIVSASLDGTVRAYDMTRYRNFRTLVSPRPVQFACLALDTSDEFLAAGGQDVFEIFLWSVKVGRLLEILSGHEGPVASLAFSPSPASSALASVSWDKTLKLWNAIESGSSHETIQLTADGLCVVYKPDGQQVAVATLDGQISFFDCKTSDQLGSIEGRMDLGSGRSDTDLVTAKQSLQGKAFTSLCYTADGMCILAGGQSKNVCIYNIQESILLKKFEVTQNRSFDAVDDFINRRKMTDFGNLALVEDRDETEGGKVALRLPGVRKGDMASRSNKPEVRVYGLQFSPTGQSWAAATTEGLLIYSLDMGLVFDPFELDVGVTPQTVKETLYKREHAKALMMALKLNEKLLIQEVIENIPYKDADLTITGLSDVYIEKVLKFIASELENTRHIHFYLLWIDAILTRQGSKINSSTQMPVLLTLQKNMQKKYDDLSKVCDFNQYTIKYIQRLGEHKARIAQVEKNSRESSDEEAQNESVTEEMEVD